MRKAAWKFFADYEKEEVWLNEMSAKGLALKDFFLGRYTFDDCKPGEYVYRIEFLEDYPGNPVSRRYLDFMAENGVEHVASWARWVYFRRKAEEGAFDIYSDFDSRIKHYQRINNLLLAITSMFTIFLSSFVIRALSEPYDLQPFNLVAIVVYVCLLAISFFTWNSYRRRIRRLKLEKELRE